MARIVAIILCMTLIVGACVVAVGSTFFGWDIFGEQTDTPHTHQYSEEITKAPTCTEEGVKTFTCSGEGCDKPTYTEPIEKIPHTEVKLDGKAATCISTGLTEGKKCSECGETTVKQETIPATGHTEVKLDGKAATCTEAGLTAGKKCSKCDSVLEAQSSVPATGHKYDDNYDATCNNEGCDFIRDAACRHTNTEVLAAVAATCTKTGLTEGLRCKDCEEILTKQETTSMLAHSWTAATCTAPKTCSVCKTTEGDALDHHWKPATCTDPKTCQRENCGATEGDALGHKWKDATCTAPQICSVCTATQGNALGHTWNDATCDTAKTCSVCKATEGSKLGHNYDEATYVWSEDNKTCTATKVCKNDASHIVTENGNVGTQTVSATCTIGGTVTYTATFNTEGFVPQIEIVNSDKLEHIIVINYKWSSDLSSCTAEEKCDRVGCTYSASETNTSSSETTLEATCAEKGTMLYTVKFLNYPVQTKEKPIYATGNHTEEIIPAVPSTCIENGLTEGKKCSVCGTTLQAQGKAALAAHTYDDKYDATCNVDGCNFVRDAECAHTQTITLAEIPATCLETGLEAGVQCANEKCGEILSGREVIPGLGHDWKAATCFDPKTCQRSGCDETEGNPLEHEWQDPTYSWNEDNNECTATIACAHGHSTTVTSTSVSEESKTKTCTEDGYVKYTAVFANAELSATKTIVDKFIGHSFTPTVTDPTCTSGGITTWSCSKCTDSYTSDPLPALNHSFTNYVSNGNATCLVDGTKTAKCDRCDETDTVEDTDSAKGHSFTDYTSNNDATCTADGTETAKCDRCTVTDTRTDADSKLDHTYDKKNTADEYLKSAATCTAEATYYYSCSCGAKGTKTFEGTTTDPTNHTGTEVNGGTENVHTKYDCCGATISSKHEYESKVTTPATCTEKGTTTYTCACGHKYTAQDVTALGHDYTEKVTDADHLKTAAENCQKVNVYWYDCSRCDANAKDDASAADKHYNSETAGEHSVSDEWTNADGKHFHKCEYCDYTEDEGTCSDVDTDTDHKCDVCDAEGITSHTYNQTVATDTYKATDATCTAQATYYTSCKCGVKGSETFKHGEKLAHAYNQEVVDAEYFVSSATCTEKATYYKSCKCGAFDAEKSETFENGEKLTHTYAEIVKPEALKSEADCDNAAIYYKSCEHCGVVSTSNSDTFTDGSANGHTPKADDGDCTTAIVCSVCGAETTAANSNHTYSAEGRCTICGKADPDYVELLDVTLSVPDRVEAVELGYNNVLPEAGAPEGYTFAGWSEKFISDTTDTPELLLAGSTYAGSKGLLYAVYTRVESTPETSWFEKVTSAPADWSGNYLIVYEYGLVAFNGSLETLDVASNTVAVTIEDGKIKVTDLAKAAVFTVDSNGYIKSASGYYIGQTSDANGLKSSSDTKYDNTISIDNDGNVNIVSGGAYLRYNSAVDQLRFRYYKSTSYTGQKAIQLYKLITIEATSTTHHISLSECQHVDTSTATTQPTKTQEGVTTVTCNDCKQVISRTTTPALGCKVTFIVPEGAIAPTVGDCVTVTLPDGVGAPDTFNAQEYVFAGWVMEEVKNSSIAPTVYEAGDKVELTDDTTFYAVYTYSVEDENNKSYQLTDISNITSTDVVIVTMTASNDTVYALGNDNGTGSAPAAYIITVSDNKVKDNQFEEVTLWTVGGSADAYVFYPNGNTAKWLYVTDTNNGVRVGTGSAKTFKIDATSGYLLSNDYTRYLGVYTTNPDWRCYGNTTDNTANQTLGFYVLKSEGAVTYYTTELLTGAHEHSYSVDSTIDPTCFNSGYIVYACSCGDSYQEENPDAEALGHTDGDDDYMCDRNCGTVVSPTKDTLTIAEAIKLGNCYANNTFSEKKYLITGTITEITGIVDGNMYIEDAEGNKLYIYNLSSSDGETSYSNMETKPVVGDTITVLSIVGKYNSKPQAKKAWLTYIQPHECEADGTATCLVPSVCTICGETMTEQLEHVDTDSDGICNNGCGQKISTEEPETNKTIKCILSAKKTITYYVTSEVSSKTLLASTDETKAATFYLETTDNTIYYIYTIDDSGKRNYYYMTKNDTKAMATTDDNTVGGAGWTIDADNKRIVNATYTTRALALYSTTDVRTYAISGSYNWVWYTEVQ